MMHDVSSNLCISISAVIMYFLYNYTISNPQLPFTNICNPLSIRSLPLMSKLYEKDGTCLHHEF